MKPLFVQIRMSEKVSLNRPGSLIFCFQFCDQTLLPSIRNGQTMSSGTLVPPIRDSSPFVLRDELRCDGPRLFLLVICCRFHFDFKLYWFTVVFLILFLFPLRPFLFFVFDFVSIYNFLFDFVLLFSILRQKYYLLR